MFVRRKSPIQLPAVPWRLTRLAASFELVQCGTTACADAGAATNVAAASAAAHIIVTIDFLLIWVTPFCRFGGRMPATLVTLEKGMWLSRCCPGIMRLGGGPSCRRRRGAVIPPRRGKGRYLCLSAIPRVM